mgnify:CR=1 FL=1
MVNDTRSKTTTLTQLYADEPDINWWDCDTCTLLGSGCGTRISLGWFGFFEMEAGVWHPTASDVCTVSSPYQGQPEMYPRSKHNEGTPPKRLRKRSLGLMRFRHA